MPPPISRYPVPELADLPDDIRQRILEVQDKAGFVPNVFLGFACVVAHGAILRVYEKSPQIADQLATNDLKADITERQKAMLGFAMKVYKDAASLTEADFEAVRAHGFDDEDIWDIGAITALFGLSNRMANLMSLRPNDEFYLMGRLPREKKSG
jgi:hypothetical protein